MTKLCNNTGIELREKKLKSLSIVLAIVAVLYLLLAIIGVFKNKPTGQVFMIGGYSSAFAIIAVFAWFAPSI